jgi:hypothetical protein
LVEGGSFGCRNRFNELLARDYSDLRYFSVHRLFVDVYSLQHPDEFCASAKSLAAHLAGLCAILEGQTSSASGSADLRAWLDGPSDLTKPEIPGQRGVITIGDLPTDADPPNWAAAVRRWGEETWKVYEPLHYTARQWFSLASQAHRRH